MDHTDPVAHNEPGGDRLSPRPDPGRAARTSPLDRSLAGDLPCVACGYSLRGLSIRSACPECGTPVRAAILAVVDPLASELQPIPRPKLVAAGLIAWIGGALAAALLAWFPQIGELIALSLSVRPHHRDLSIPIVMILTLSGLGAVALIAPHAGLGRVRVGAAVVAVLAYIPLAWIMWRLCRTAETGAITDYLRGITVTQSAMLRIGVDGLIIVIALGMRFNVRVLVARSLALRQGRVDRQTLAAIAVAAGVAASGDLVGLMAADAAGSIALVPALIAMGLVATGTALLTLGLAGAFIDAIRITRALRVPSPSLRELLTPHPGGRGAPKREKGNGVGGVGGIGA